MLNFLAVFLGGGFGASLRWIICKYIPNHWGTFIVNILGSFFIGILFQYISQKTDFNSNLKLFLMTGLLGGFTTFSTYLLDFVRLLNNNTVLETSLYLILSIVVGVLSLLFGIKVIQLT